MNVRNVIVSQVAEIVDLANRKFNITMARPSVGFFNTGKKAGVCYWGREHVEFNEVLAKENNGTFKNTVIHEVAHLVTKKVYPHAKQAHGPEFRHVMRVLGGDGETYHSYDVSSTKRTMTKYEYTCGCSNHYVSPQRHNKIKSGAVFRCTTCRNAISHTGFVIKK